MPQPCLFLILNIKVKRSLLEVLLSDYWTFRQKRKISVPSTFCFLFDMSYQLVFNVYTIFYQSRFGTHTLDKAICWLLFIQSSLIYQRMMESGLWLIVILTTIFSTLFLACFCYCCWLWNGISDSKGNIRIKLLSLRLII